MFVDCSSGQRTTSWPDIGHWPSCRMTVTHQNPLLPLTCRRTVDANIWAANHVVEPERRLSSTSRRFLGLFCGYCSLQTFCLNESPWPVCSGLCYYRRLPHWLSRSDAFCSGEPGSMKGQLAGCRTGRHVLSVAFLERFHSKSRPFPTDAIKVNSNAKNMAAVVFFNLTWNIPLEIISLWQSKNGKDWIFLFFFPRSGFILLLSGALDLGQWSFFRQLFSAGTFLELSKLSSPPHTCWHLAFSLENIFTMNFHSILWKTNGPVEEKTNPYQDQPWCLEIF